MKDSIGWGILGAGSIAGRFATDLRNLPDARLVAVGSRSADKAAQFAREHGEERSYGSYAEMIAIAETMEKVRAQIGLEYPADTLRPADGE